MTISIRTKLFLLYVVTISVLLLAFFTYIYFNFSHAIYDNDVIDRFDDELVKIGAEISQNIAGSHGPFYAPIKEYQKWFDAQIGEDLFLNPTFGQLADMPAQFGDKPLIKIQNSVIQGRSIPLTEAAFYALKKNKYSIETFEGIFEFPIRVVTLKAFDREGQAYVLQLGMSMEHISATLSNVLVNFFTTWPVVVVIVSIMGYLFVRQSFSPVKKIVKLTRSITAEDLSQRIEPIARGDEIGDLITTLNNMISRLERSFDQIRQFSDDVSHELKTPLTILKGEIEVALRHKRDEGEYLEILASLLEETNKLGKIIEDLFLLSRIDFSREQFLLKEASLDRVIMDVFEDTYILAKEKNISFSLEKIEEANIKGDAGLLKRLFANLAENAVKYTQRGGRIDIQLTNDRKNGPLCTISDNGKGIPEDSIPYIFDRFYRVDKSRSGKTGGSGLGLTIVKKILDLHNGSISVESKVKEGAKFFINFPNN